MSGYPCTDAVERTCAPFATCAEAECSQDAVTEVRHAPNAERLWVPFCASHRALIGREPINYVVDLHGFIPVEKGSQ